MSADIERPKVRDDLIVVEIDDELVVVDRRHEGLHHLNRSAAAVFHSCNGTATYAQISAALAATYAVPFTQMQHYVAPVLDRLAQARLLEGADDGCVECGH